MTSIPASSTRKIRNGHHVPTESQNLFFFSLKKKKENQGSKRFHNLLVEMTVTLTQDQDQKVPLRTERTGLSTGSGRVSAWGLHARQVAVRRRA